jgi:FAD:protein FMN transferase
MRLIKITATAIAAALLIAGCARDGGLYKETRTIMGTYVTITAVRGALPEVVVRAAVNDAFAEIVRVDDLMSTYKPESQLSLVNARAGEGPVKVDRELAETVKDALDIAAMTGGGFDPTVEPLVKLWGIASKDARVPSESEIQNAVRLVDYRDVAVDLGRSTVVIKRKGMSIDLGGIAKGYAADRAVEALRKGGVTAGIVAVAGDLRLFGKRPDGRLWRIGIQHPRDKDALIAKLDVTDAATSTSGDYERYFIKNGVRYHHILDPKTGYPARGLVSVSVLAPKSWLADSLATGLFVMGPDRAYAFAKAHPQIEVLMVKDDGSVLSTGRFEKLGVSHIELGEGE